MSHFDTDKELENIENLQQQTRDPFQLELLDAVKRRQKKETGFEDGDKSTQRHSKELDIKMAKFLANKQSPFREEKSSRESPNFKGDASETTYLGTGDVNNRRTTSAQNSKWSPSINVDSDEDFEGDFDSSSDEDDAIVIGSNTRINEIKQNQGLSKLKDRGNINERNNVNLSDGLNTTTKNSIEYKKESRSDGRGINEENTSSQVGRPRKFGVVKEPTGKTHSIEDTGREAKRTSDKSKVAKRDKTMERPGLRRRGKSVDSDDDDEGTFDGMTNDNEFLLSAKARSNNIEPSPRTRSEIDDIFGKGATRKPTPLQDDEGNIRNSSKLHSLSKNSASENGYVHSVDHKDNEKKPRSRSGSRKEQKDTDDELGQFHMKSGRNTPSNELDRERRKSGRNSPFDDLSIGHSKQSHRTEKDSGSISKPDREGYRSRSGSGRDSPGDAILSKSEGSKMPKEVKERPRSAKKDLSSSAKTDRDRPRSGSGRDSPGDAITSKSEESKLSKGIKERPKSAKIRSIDASGKSISKEKIDSGSDSDEEVIGKPLSRKERQEGKDKGSSKSVRNDSKSRFDISSPRHRRSLSTEYSPRSVKEKETKADSSYAEDTGKGRSRSKSDARIKNEAAKGDTERNRDFNLTRGRKEDESGDLLNRKYSLKTSGSLKSARDKTKQSLLDSDEDDDDEDDLIGIKRPVSAFGKQNNKVNDQEPEGTRTPGIKRALVLDVHKSRKATGKERRSPRDDEEDEDSERRIGSSKQRSKNEEKIGKEQLNKFKIKGRTDGATPKGSPMKANMTMNGAVSVPNKTRKAGKDSSPRETMNKTLSKRSLSFTNISNINPKSPFKDEEESSGKRRTSFVDSNSLREQIYYDWLSKKNSKTKSEIAELRKREKEKEEEAEREKQDKKVMSIKAFEAWQSNKEGSIKEIQSARKDKKVKEKEKQDEAQQKKLDAKKFFESWKSKKDEELVEKHKKRKEETREKRRKEMEDKEEKTTSAKKVYENWKSKKEELLKEKIKEKKEQDKEKRLKEIEQREKKQEAQKMYETWKEKKIKSPREEKTLTQRAWCPSSRNSANAIPQGVRPVIQRNPPNRSRTLSASARLQSGTMRSTFTRT